VTAITRAYVAAAIFLSVSTVFLWREVSELEWEPEAAFDILGFLWLLSNIPNLFACLALLACAALAAVCWLRVIGKRD
jgi:hypothetical protein